MNINLNEYVACNADGTVDQDAMLLKLAPVVAKFADERDGVTAALERTLDEIYDAEEPGQCIQTMLLATKVLTHRKLKLDSMNSMKKEIQAFLKVNTRFEAVVGRGNGVKRLRLKDAENAREHGLAADAEPAAEPAAEPEAIGTATTEAPPALSDEVAAE